MSFQTLGKDQSNTDLAEIRDDKRNDTPAEYGYDADSEDGGEAALAIRDDPETLGWWYGVTAKDIDLQDYNFEIMMEMGRHQMLDNYASLSGDYELPLREFINGDYTTAQLQETYRQTIQDGINALLGK